MNQIPLRVESSRLGCVALMLGVLALLIAQFPPDRVPEVQPASASEVEFSGERAMATLTRLLGDQRPHSAGTAAHTAMRERLILELRALGLEAEVHESLARGPGGRIALVRNVLARIGAPTGKAILLAAHYDSVGAAPGASDDGAGVAVLLEIARSLNAHSIATPVILLFSDGEELGLIGANAFAAEHRWSADVGVVINLEARGTGGPSMMFETSGPSAALIPPLARAARLPFASSLSDLIYKYMPNDTDLSVFRARGVPGYNFAFIGGLARYHTPLDDLAHLDPRSVQHHGDQALALTRELARAPLEDLRGGEAVYFDVLGFFILHWSRSFGVAAALVVAAITAWRCARARASGQVTARGLVSSIFGVTLAFALSVGLAWTMTMSLAAWHGVPDPGAVAPATLRFACAGWVLASFCGTAWIAAKLRANFASAWIAGLALTGLGAVAATFVLSRASHLALVPAAVWCAAEILFDPTRQSSSRRMIPLVALALIQGVLWIPIAHATELGFGFRLGPMVAGPMAFALLASWPALLTSSPRFLRCASIASVVLAFAGIVANVSRPARDVDAPAWMNVRYILDGDTAQARFEVSTFGAELPDSLARLHRFEPARTPPFPWLSLDPSMHVVDAPVWDVALPRVEVLKSVPIEDGRSVRAKLSSPRGTARLHLHLAEGVRIRAVFCAGRSIESGFDKVRTQLFFAVPSDGLEIEFDVRGDAPARVFLLDQDWSLPESIHPLLEARPRDYAPRSDGDVSLLGHSFLL